VTEALVHQVRERVGDDRDRHDRRTVDGTIGRFKPGVGFLTAGTDFPVVPCHLDGAFRAWPKSKWFPRPRKVKLSIGSPMLFRSSTPTKEDAVAIADALRDAVVSLGNWR
jgi:1-acyl-sn-glycerol-3-phosphate acyltransferase